MSVRNMYECFTSHIRVLLAWLKSKQANLPQQKNPEK